jgi:hypothetical protein
VRNLKDEQRARFEELEQMVEQGRGQVEEQVGAAFSFSSISSSFSFSISYSFSISISISFSFSSISSPQLRAVAERRLESRGSLGEVPEGRMTNGGLEEEEELAEAGSYIRCSGLKQYGIFDPWYKRKSDK